MLCRTIIVEPSCISCSRDGTGVLSPLPVLCGFDAPIVFNRRGSRSAVTGFSNFKSACTILQRVGVQQYATVDRCSRDDDVVCLRTVPLGGCCAPTLAHLRRLGPCSPLVFFRFAGTNDCGQHAERCFTHEIVIVCTSNSTVNNIHVHRSLRVLPGSTPESWYICFIAYHNRSAPWECPVVKVNPEPTVLRE